MTKKYWIDNDNPDKVVASGGWRLGVIVWAVVIFAGITGAAWWAVSVATSEIRGRGDATKIVNDGRNQVNAQEWFQGKYGEILGADAKLQNARDAWDAAKGTPDEGMWMTSYTGLKNRCVQMVTEYNAEAGKISRGKWMDPSVPQRIDGSDPATDCSEPARPSTAVTP